MDFTELLVESVESQRLQHQMIFGLCEPMPTREEIRAALVTHSARVAEIVGRTNRLVPQRRMFDTAEIEGEQ